MKAARSQQLPVHGTRIHVRTYHDTASDLPGPPILLLHGGMAHARWFDFLAPRLARARPVFAWDRRGHGDSDWAEPETYGWDQDVRDAEAIIEALSPEGAVLVGHSQGGLFAVQLAAQLPERVRALVLLDIPLRPRDPALVRVGSRLRKIPQLEHADLERAMRRFQPFPGPHRIADESLAHVARYSFRELPNGRFTSKFDWRRFRVEEPEPHPLDDFECDLGDLTMPALLLRAEESVILTREDAARFEGLVPRGSMREVGGTTHHLHVEAPDAVAAHIEDFLGLPGGSSVNLEGAVDVEAEPL